MKLTLHTSGKDGLPFDFKNENGHVTVASKDRELSLERLYQNEHTHVYLLGGEVFNVTVLRRHGERVDVLVNGAFYDLHVVDEKRKTSSLAPLGSLKEIKAVMPGRVTKVLVKPGDAVSEGMPLLVLEAMKMENEIKASAAGTVEKIAVNPGDTVESGHLLVKLA